MLRRLLLFFVLIVQSNTDAFDLRQPHGMRRLFPIINELKEMFDPKPHLERIQDAFKNVGLAKNNAIDPQPTFNGTSYFSGVFDGGVSHGVLGMQNLTEAKNGGWIKGHEESESEQKF